MNDLLLKARHAIMNKRYEEALENYLKVGLQLVRPKWVRIMPDKVLSLLVVDIDHCGSKEIIFGSENRSVYCVSGELGTLKWRTPIGGCARGGCIATIDQEDYVAIGAEDNCIYILDPETGRIKNRVFTGGWVRTVAMQDVDNDGIPELIAGTSSGLYIFDASLNLKTILLTNSCVYSLDFKDINHDDNLEIIVGTGDSVIVLDHQFQVIWSQSVNVARSVKAIECNGYERILVGSNDRQLHSFGFVSRSDSTFETQGVVFTVDYGLLDGEMRVIVGSQDRRVYILSPELKLEWAYFTGDWVRAVTLCDIAGDNCNELIVGTEGNHLRVDTVEIIPGLREEISVAYRQAGASEEWLDYLSLEIQEILNALNEVGSSQLPVNRMERAERAARDLEYRKALIACLQVARSPVDFRWVYSTGDTVRRLEFNWFQDKSMYCLLAASEDGFAYCLSDQGSMIWRRDLGDKVFVVRKVPQAQGSHLEVVAGTEDGRVVALDNTGEVRWSALTGGRVRAVHCPLLSANQLVTVLVGSEDRFVYNFTDNGLGLQEVWRVELGHRVRQVSSCFDPITERRVCVAACEDALIYFVDIDTGRVLRTMSSIDKIFSMSIGKLLTEQDNIVIGTEDNSIYALDMNGKPLWQFETGHWIRDVAITDLDMNGENEVLAVSEDGKLYILDSGGGLLWQVKLPGRGYSIAAGDSKWENAGLIFVGCRDKRVYAFELVSRQEIDSKLSVYANGMSEREVANDLRRDANEYIRGHFLLLALLGEALDVWCLKDLLTDQSAVVRSLLAKSLPTLVRYGQRAFLWTVSRLFLDSSRQVKVALLQTMYSIATSEPALVLEALSLKPQGAVEGSWVAREYVRCVGRVAPYSSEKALALLSDISVETAWVQREVAQVLALILSNDTRFLSTGFGGYPESVIRMVIQYVTSVELQTVLKSYLGMIGADSWDVKYEAMKELRNSVLLLNPPVPVAYQALLNTLLSYAEVISIRDLDNVLSQVYEFYLIADRSAAFSMNKSSLERLREAVHEYLSTAEQTERVALVHDMLVYSEDFVNSITKDGILSLILHEAGWHWRIVISELRSLPEFSLLVEGCSSEQHVYLHITNKGLGVAKVVDINIVDRPTYKLTLDKPSLPIRVEAGETLTLAAQLETFSNVTSEEALVLSVNVDFSSGKSEEKNHKLLHSPLEVRFKTTELTDGIDFPNVYAPESNRGHGRTRPFVGRAKIMQRLLAYVDGESLRPIFLKGLYRAGKTEILRRLDESARSMDRCIPVFYDGQRAPANPNLILYELAEKLSECRIPGSLDKPQLDAYLTDADFMFGRCIDRFVQNNPGLFIVLLVDEVESFVAKIQPRLDFFRGLLNTLPNLKFVCAGTFIPTEAYHLFNAVDTVEVQFLSQQDTEELIVHPTADVSYEMVYGQSQHLIREITDITGGVPYLVQCFCWELINELKRRGSSTATTKDVITICDTGYNHDVFYQYWKQVFSLENQKVALHLANAGGRQFGAWKAWVELEASTPANELCEMGFLKRSVDRVGTNLFSWRIGWFQRWIVETQPQLKIGIKTNTFQTTATAQ